jgi:hypothetical protein
MTDRPPNAYAEIVKAVNEIISRFLYGSDPSAIAYMIARAALLVVRGRHGASNAADLAQRLADEFRAETKKAGEA